VPDYTPVFNPGNELTFTASAPLVGGQLVVVTGPNAVGPAPANTSATVGVAAFDAAAGSIVTVFVKAMVHETVAAGAIAAGQDLTTAANGQVAARGSGPNRLGIALTTAADGARVRWLDIDTPPTLKATAAVAGTPGTFTPAGSLTPINLADMTGVTASPATLWTVGQRVVTSSGAEVYWTGTAWAAGRAPA
jgi:hypothetical protein